MNRGGRFRKIPLAIDNNLTDTIIQDRVRIFDVMRKWNTIPIIELKDDRISIFETPRRVLNNSRHLMLYTRPNGGLNMVIDELIFLITLCLSREA